MKAFEERALESVILKQRLRVRYIDDTFVLWQHGVEELKKFYQHFNWQHQSIQFMMEKDTLNAQ